MGGWFDFLGRPKPPPAAPPDRSKLVEEAANDFEAIQNTTNESILQADVQAEVDKLTQKLQRHVKKHHRGAQTADTPDVISDAEKADNDNIQRVIDEISRLLPSDDSNVLGHSVDAYMWKDAAMDKASFHLWAQMVLRNLKAGMTYPNEEVPSWEPAFDALLAKVPVPAAAAPAAT
jgi:hypothetical protein